MSSAGESEHEERRETVRSAEYGRVPVFDIDGMHVGTETDVVGEVVAVSGQVSMRSETRPRLVEGAFRCVRCYQIEREQQGYGRIREPPFCRGCETKTTPWRKLDGESDWDDHQMIQLQPPPEDMDGDSTTVDGVLEGDLAREGVESGERVTVIARYKPFSPDGKTVHKRLLEVQEVHREDESLIDVEAHHERIDELAAREEVVDLLVASTAPGHIGDEHIKEALLLMLVRGNAPTSSSGKEYRGTVHMLLAGDPGTGKTDFGRAAQRIVPNSGMTSGNGGTSAAGLTAAITKSKFGYSDSEWTISAGALPETTGGVLFVDEIDKAGEGEHDSMLEAMEDGEINLQKAGEKATLKAETAVLAGANPEDGHFRDGETPAAQVDLPSPLLTRFDLIFTPREKTEREDIDEIAEGVTDSRDLAIREDNGGDVPDDLRENVAPPIDGDVLAAYVESASRLSPEYGDGVKRFLRNWYVETKVRLVQEERESGREIPVTPRSLEDLLRLAEASAKLRHDETVRMRDAERATRLKARSFREFGVDSDPVEVEASDDGDLSVSGETPTVALLEIIEEEKLSTAEYGADPEAVLDRAAAEIESCARSELEGMVDDLIDGNEVSETPDGRLVA
ncbi:ATP-binding protein [Halobaculum sp. EA56]|uniref:ATP-binding protein n=1 Tax=Halobaculum sp. EA56 TaxID=3421648 RepID=UPI003EBE3465